MICSFFLDLDAVQLSRGGFQASARGRLHKRPFGFFGSGGYTLANASLRLVIKLVPEISQVSAMEIFSLCRLAGHPRPSFSAVTETGRVVSGYGAAAPGGFVEKVASDEGTIF